jgi:hypothetical protein
LRSTVSDYQQLYVKKNEVMQVAQLIERLFAPLDRALVLSSAYWPEPSSSIGASEYVSVSSHSTGFDAN